MKLDIGEPVSVQELLAKPIPAGRQPSERDIALQELVAKVAEPENEGKAFPWNYAPIKPASARQAAIKAVDRAGLKGQVFVSSRDGKLYFSQHKLSNRGRKS